MIGRDGRPATVRISAQMIQQRFDVYFNLCDGAADQDAPGIEVVETLEQFGVAFTGSTSEFYEPSREQMKQACLSVGIHTPAWVVAKDDEDVERAAETLKFPLFVKHHSSYSSVDLSRASKVNSPGGLRVLPTSLLAGRI